MATKLPSICPSCDSLLDVTELTCKDCKTMVRGSFSLPLFLHLSPKEQDFILNFFLTSGSLKEMASQLGISYPTVRNQLDDMIEHIKDLQKNINTHK